MKYYLWYGYDKALMSEILKYFVKSKIRNE